MTFNRKKLGALLLAFAVTAVVAGTAGATHLGTPGVTKKTITIGGTFPFTGPISLYKTIPLAEEAYYAYVNAHGGVNGRKIKWDFLDDQYDPSQTVPDVQKLVQQDHVFAIVGSLGTAPGLATWGYLNQNKVPQVLLATGDAYWGNCVHHSCNGVKPWTTGWQPDYPAEAKLYASYILKNKPNAKIGVIYQDDAYGKNYLAGFKAGLGSKASQIVDAEPFNYTDSAQVVGAHVVKIATSGADTFVIFATPAAAIASLVTESKIPGWHPLTFLNSVSASRTFMLSAIQNGASLDGVITAGYLSSQVSQKNLPGMKLAKSIIAKYAPALSQDFALGDATIVYGLGTGYTFVDALKHAGKNPTRASFMKAMRSLNETNNPFVYPGIVVKMSKTRTFPMEQSIVQKWVGGNSGDWKGVGGIVNSGH